MIVEVAEKTRSEIRAIKILLGLLELGHVFYIIGIVIKNATSFMLQDFVFVQRIESCRFEHRVRARSKDRDEVGVLGLAPWAFHFPHPLFTFAPPDLLFYIFVFSCIFLFFVLVFIFSNDKKYPKIIYLFSHFYFILFICFLT